MSKETAERHRGGGLPDEKLDEIAERIRQYANLTPRQISELTGISPSTVKLVRLKRPDTEGYESLARRKGPHGKPYKTKK